MTTNQKLLRHTGTFLMLCGVTLFLYIYYPIATLYFFPAPENKIQTQRTNSYWIEIPKINAASPIVKNVDPWNETEYKQALKKGVAHAKGTSLPGKGKTYLFAHSSDYPWNITRYNTAFFKLNELKTGDNILIHNGTTVFSYTVRETKEVWPTEVQYFKNQKTDLILQTCTTIGTDLKRLLVFAELN
jgi:sortase A